MQLTRADYEWVQQVCPICGAPPNTFIGVRGGNSHRSYSGVEAEVWRCGRCRLIFPNPMPVPKGGIAQHYSMSPDEYFVLHDPAGKMSGARRLLEQAESFIPKGRLLDVGSGRGEVAIAAAQRGWHVTCMEPSPAFAKALREKGLRVLEQTLETADLQSGAFDAVVLSAVLEHLYNPKEIMETVRRLLRPGGILFLDIPNESGLYFKLGNLYHRITGSRATINLSPTFAPYHVFGYDRTSVTKLLAAHGMAPIWMKIYPGVETLPAKKGLRGRIERLGVKAAAMLSRALNQGSYIELWAVKK